MRINTFSERKSWTLIDGVVFTLIQFMIGIGLIKIPYLRKFSMIIRMHVANKQSIAKFLKPLKSVNPDLEYSNDSRCACAGNSKSDFRKTVGFVFGSSFIALFTPHDSLHFEEASVLQKQKKVGKTKSATRCKAHQNLYQPPCVQFLAGGGGSQKPTHVEAARSGVLASKRNDPPEANSHRNPPDLHFAYL